MGDWMEIAWQAETLALEWHETPAFKELASRGLAAGATDEERARLIDAQLAIQHAMWYRANILDAARQCEENAEGEEWKHA